MHWMYNNCRFFHELTYEEYKARQKKTSPEKKIQVYKGQKLKKVLEKIVMYAKWNERRMMATRCAPDNVFRFKVTA